MVRFSLAVLLGTLLWCCGNTPNGPGGSSIPSPPFTITEAYVQDWVAGVPEGGKGTNFYLQLQEAAPGVQFQKVYIRKQSAPLKPMADSSLTWVGHLTSAVASEILMDSDPVTEAQNEISIRIRFQLKENQAVVSYLYKRELHYHTVDSVMRKEPLHYPAPPPN